MFESRNRLLKMIRKSGIIVALLSVNTCFSATIYVNAANPTPGTGATWATAYTTDCLGYYLPDAFTPNGDGRYEIFRVRTGDFPKVFSLIIFNRYGGKAFETPDVNTGWNGTLGGNPAGAGVYVYVMTVTTSTGRTIRKKGTVMLVR